MKELYNLHAEMCKVFSNPIIDNSDDYITSKSEFSNKTISKKGDLIKEIVYRLEILNLLRDKELSVTELMNKSKLSQANISQHLSIMKSKGIVNSERDGKNICYKLSNPKIIKAFDIIRKVLTERLEKSRKIIEETKI
jgi:ArsR family transcriptional regulator